MFVTNLALPPWLIIVARNSRYMFRAALPIQERRERKKGGAKRQNTWSWLMVSQLRSGNRAGLSSARLEQAGSPHDYVA